MPTGSQDEITEKMRQEAKAHNDRGFQLFQQQNYHGAIAALDLADALVPDDWQTIGLRGMAKKREEQFYAAYKDLDYAHHLAPDEKRAKGELEDLRSKVGGKGKTKMSRSLTVQYHTSSGDVTLGYKNHQQTIEKRWPSIIYSGGWHC